MTLGTRRNWVSLFGLGLLVVGAMAVAPDARGQGDARAAAADVLFSEALQLAKDGEFVAAVAKFKASYQLDPTLGTLLGLAMSEEKAGLVASAYAHYNELLDLARRAGDTKREQQARAGIEDTEPRLAWLTLSTPTSLPEQSIIQLDGRELPLAAVGSALPLDPGEHNLHVETPGGATFDHRFRMEEGRKVTVEVELTQPPVNPAPLTAPEPTVDASSSGVRTTGLVVGVVGIAALAGGTYMWMRSSKSYDDLANMCPQNQCPASAQDTIDSGKSQERWATVGFLLGGVGLAAGATLYVLGAPDETPTNPEASPPLSARLAVGPGSLQFLGSF